MKKTEDPIEAEVADWIFNIGSNKTGDPPVLQVLELGHRTKRRVLARLPSRATCPILESEIAPQIEALRAQLLKDD